MSHKTTATVAHTIGIDTGKNTLVCTENVIRVDDVMESPKLAE
jgi:hypothetical protein